MGNATSSKAQRNKGLAAFDGDIVIFGAGAMAGAMLRRWLDTGLPPARVTAVRKSGVAVADGVTTLSDATALPAPAVLLIGVKPQQLPALLPAIEPLAGPETLVLSILAGVTLADLAAALPRARAIVRLMPNMPVAEGRGVVVRAGDATGVDAARADALLAPLGHVHAVADEAGFDLVTALTGCGPAFVYRFVGALAGAATRLGMDPADADRLARATVAGAAASLADSPQTPHALADAVASPGGMTQAGLDVLDDNGRLAALLAETLRAARERGKQLAAAARGEG